MADIKTKDLDKRIKNLGEVQESLEKKARKINSGIEEAKRELNEVLSQLRETVISINAYKDLLPDEGTEED